MSARVNSVGLESPNEWSRLHAQTFNVDYTG
jgi:hypothetical protein